jgi:chloride channel protein, CIC family
MHGAEHERQRRSRLLVRQRLPSGRGAMGQPNITSHGAGVLTARFWALLVMTGIAAGLFGALMMLILFNVQYAAFGYHSQPGARRSSRPRTCAG